MSSAKLKANNDWLVWARKTAHYDIDKIAEKMNVDSNQIEEWESTGKIEYDELVKLAEYYQRNPMIFFNANKPAYDEEEVPDLRTFGSKKKKITPEIIFEVRNASTRRQILLEIEEESPDYTIPKFQLSNINYQNSKDISNILMDYLEITKAKIHSKSLDYWIKEIESLGVLIFQFYGLDPKEIRGYALYHEKLPIIGINSKEYKNGKKFTLFHELAHLIIKKNGISNFADFYLENDEFLCNKIAAETLVPTDWLENKIKNMEFSDNWTDSKIKHLSQYFNVSEEVIVRRLLTLNYVTPSFYKNRKKKWDSYIAIKQESSSSYINRESKNKNKKEKAPVDPRLGYKRKAANSLNTNGRLFTNYILKAYDEDLISIDEVADSLGVSLEVIREIQEKIMLEES